jgi:outer membrane cobalamin receptor
MESRSHIGDYDMETKYSCLKISILLIFFAAILYLNIPAFADGKSTDLTGLSLDELMNIEVVSTATLTETKPRLVPAAVTTINAEQIKASGARSMFELLDIYVPNLEWLRHHWEPDAIGLRGIINDRNDKFLLLVNGRNMNQHTHSGAISELDLVELRDIHHIDVVRGPGSALYGPGAVSMVINIITLMQKPSREPRLQLDWVPSRNSIQVKSSMERNLTETTAALSCTQASANT